MTCLGASKSQVCIIFVDLFMHTFDFTCAMYSILVDNISR